MLCLTVLLVVRRAYICPCVMSYCTFGRAQGLHLSVCYVLLYFWSCVGPTSVRVLCLTVLLVVRRAYICPYVMSYCTFGRA